MEFKIENTYLYGIFNAYRASGNPMRVKIEQPDNAELLKDKERAKKLAGARLGTGHDNFLNGIIVQFDLYAPLYMWKQIQRYHWMDFISSQSTMHCLTKFKNIKEHCVSDVDHLILTRYQELLDSYNNLEETNTDTAKELWRKLVASLPSGFVLGATMTTNFRQLKTIYEQRKYHKLKEWREFCKWIESIDSNQLITE